MPRNLQTQAQLQAKINRLEKENVRLRTLFQMTLDIAYQAVNGKENQEKEETDRE